MKKVEKNSDKEQLFPKNQTSKSAQLWKSVKLLGESSEMYEKYGRPSCSNDVLGILLKNQFLKLFPNESQFQVSCTRVLF